MKRREHTRREEQSMHPGQDEEKKGAPRCAREPGREEEGRERGACTKERRGRASCVSALYGAGLRPSLRPVSGSTSLLEASQKGRSSLPTASQRVSTNRGRAAPPRFCHTPRRTRREKSARLSELLWFPFAFDSCCLRGGWLRAWRCGVDGVVVEVGCGDVGCSKIMTGKEKRLSQRVAAQ